MAQLTFPIRARELQVDVRVNLCAPDLAALHGNHQPAPAAIVTRAVLDTGSNVIGVATSVIQRLALSSHANSSTHGIAGSVPVKLYRISLSVFDPTRPTSP